MAEYFRVTLTLILAIHVTLLAYLSLTATSGNCKEPTIAHIEIENTINTDSPELSGINAFSQQKPVCIGVLGTARMDGYLSQTLNNAVTASDSLPLLGAVENYRDNENRQFVQLKDTQKYTCDQTKKTCFPSFAGTEDLLDCETDCNPDNDDALALLSTIRQDGYEVCGDLFIAITTFLAGQCKQESGAACDITTIFNNLSDSCDRIKLAGILLGAGLGASYVSLSLLLWLSQGTSRTSRPVIVLLSFFFFSSLVLLGSSFVMYNFELYGDQVDTYFWTPIVKRVQNGFKTPISDSFASAGKVTIVMGSSYYYLAAACFVNLGAFVLLCAAVAFNENAEIVTRISSSVGGKVKQAVGSLIF